MKSADPSAGHPRTIKLAKAKARVASMLGKIRAAHQAGKRERADYLTKRYLLSLDARDVAVQQACRKLKPLRRPSPSKLPAIAEHLNAWDGTAEPVVLSFKEKESKPNHYRSLLDFGIENRALQYLVLGALKARADLHPNQYAMRGSHAAIQRVAELMANGYEYAVEIDIKDCFPSFDGEKVPDLLPLPKRVTKSVLLNGSHNLVYHSHWESTFGQAKPEANQTIFAAEHAGAQRGFPQGSAASPLAVEMLLTPLYAQLPATGVSLGYADNFLALGKQETEAVATSKAFGCALKAHPAGHLVPNVPKSFGPGQPIVFLGYRLQMCNGSVLVAPTLENVQSFWDRVNFAVFRIKATSDKKTAYLIADDAHRFVHAWTSTFILCTEISSYRVKARERIALALK